MDQRPGETRVPVPTPTDSSRRAGSDVGSGPTGTAARPCGEQGETSSTHQPTGPETRRRHRGPTETSVSAGVRTTGGVGEGPAIRGGEGRPGGVATRGAEGLGLWTSKVVPRPSASPIRREATHVPRLHPPLLGRTTTRRSRYVPSSEDPDPVPDPTPVDTLGTRDEECVGGD